MNRITDKMKNLFSRNKNMESGENVVSVNRKVKLGLVLGGGGTRGIGHIGVLKAFEELGVKFDYVAGTSAGSMVGALYCKGLSSDEMKKIIISTKRKEVLGGLIPFIKPAKTELLEKFINNSLGDVTLFSELKTPLTVVCTDLKTGKEIDFSYGNVAKVVSASCAVPGIFNPVSYEDMNLVDGGLRNNVPADVVKKMGANVVIAVDVNHLRGSGTSSVSTVSVLSSTIGIMMQAKVDQTLGLADLIIEPALENFSPLKLDGAEEMVKIGYETVMANRSKIEKLLGLNPRKIDKYFDKRK